MPPNSKTPTNTPTETSIVVALMEQIEGLRSESRAQTESITKKLDAQSEEARAEFKELRKELSAVTARMASGSEVMRALRRDVDGVKAHCALTHSPTALERKSKNASNAETEPITKSKPIPWWLVLLIGGVLSVVGERFAKFVINGMADPPAATSKP